MADLLQLTQDGGKAREDLRLAVDAFLGTDFQEFNIDEVVTYADFLEFEQAYSAERGNFNSMTKALAELDAVVQSFPPIDDAAPAATEAAAAQEEESNLIASVPIRLTTSGKNEHPRMAADRNGDIWLVWQRSGSSEIMASKYFGGCGIWNMPGQGGAEIRVTNFGTDGRQASFPSVAIGLDGEAHVAFQVATTDGRHEVFYTRTVGGGAAFVEPLRITKSSGNAMMPDIAVTRDLGDNEKVVIVWHDDRFGEFEIMAAEFASGQWRSSGQGGADIRITQSEGESLFPRIAADSKGNMRVVYHDNRRESFAIYMSTFVTLSSKWDSSGQGGSDRLISNGPADAVYPTISIDHTGGTSVAWHDFRHALDNPDHHEEVYALYCQRLGHPGGVHFPPLQPNIEARLDVDFQVVDCVDQQPVDFTNSPEVCLKIRAPGATFWRAANEDGAFSEWAQFKPNFDLETLTVPWTLNCTGGGKRVCVQVQDAQMVGFPICRDVTLAIQPTGFKIELFADEDMTLPLPTFRGRPVSPAGDVFVKFTSTVPQLLPPIFDVISRGEHVIFNQETEPIGTSGADGFSGSAGIGSFIGKAFSREFSAQSATMFKGRFNVKRDDGLLHVDGPARILVHGKSICDVLPSTKEPDPVEVVTTGPASGEPPEQDDPPLGPPATPSPPTFAITTGSANVNQLAQFSLGENGPGRNSVNVYVAGQTYAIGQSFLLERRASLSSVKIKILHTGLASMAGHRLTADLVQLETLRGPVKGAFYAPVQTATIDASFMPTRDPSLPISLSTIPAASMAITGFTGNPAEPGIYAIVFREAKEVPVFDHPWWFEIGTKTFSVASPRPILYWRLSERTKFPPGETLRPPVGGNSIDTGNHEIYMELTFVSA